MFSSTSVSYLATEIRFLSEKVPEQLTPKLLRSDAPLSDDGFLPGDTEEFNSQHVKGHEDPSTSTKESQEGETDTYAGNDTNEHKIALQRRREVQKRDKFTRTQRSRSASPPKEQSQVRPRASHGEWHV